ncbi:MAG: tRNA (adenosine(37)-N6)-threonylcarbamoyltransferase complex dimerization subunit type 1 TsaB, partial [bacterium]
RTLAQVLNKPVVGIPTLDSLAHNVSSTEHLICPVIDALRGEVYTSLYASVEKRNKKIKRLTDYSIIKIDDFLGQFLNPGFPKIIFVGPAVKLYEEFIRKRWPQKALMASAANNQPQGQTVARLGLEALKRKKGQKWDKLLPLYIRQASAEVHPVKKSTRVVFR